MSDGALVLHMKVRGRIEYIEVGGSPLFEAEPGHPVSEVEVRVNVPYASELTIGSPRLAAIWRDET